MVRIGNRWDELLADEWEKPYYRELRGWLADEYRRSAEDAARGGDGLVYPPAGDIFNALKLTDYDDVKAVILGQDPYHEPGQAQGLAFSVPQGITLPPSLVNILKEMDADPWRDTLAKECGEQEAADNAAGISGVLVPWAEQGVLLLNTVLTVGAHQAASHRGRGWEQFTDRVIELLAARTKPVCFVLWGAQARAKGELIRRTEASAPAIDSPESSGAENSSSLPAHSAAGAGDGRRHLIIEAPHPSPLSAYRGFFGGRYFSRINWFLLDNGMEPVDWTI